MPNRLFIRNTHGHNIGYQQVAGNRIKSDILAEEIIENLEAGLSSFREIMGTLSEGSN